MVDIDGSNERTPHRGQFPSWSPDGSRLTFNAPGAGGAGDIWVINADGTGLTNITQTTWGDSRPDFSPNGQKIAYTSSRTGNPEIWVMNADGTNPVQVTNHPAVEAAPDWSPNGQKILFQSTRDDPRQDIYVVDNKGVHRLTTSAGRDLDPNWSPTGQQIVFDSDRNFISEQIRQVFIMNADGSDQHPITSPARGLTRELGARALQRVLTWPGMASDFSSRVSRGVQCVDHVCRELVGDAGERTQAITS